MSGASSRLIFLFFAHLSFLTTNAKYCANNNHARDERIEARATDDTTRHAVGRPFARGGLAIGPVADKSGRRAALAATTLPLAVGTVISAASTSFWTMMLGRLVTGVGVGASSQIVPLYLSEVSPPGLRGTVNGIRRVAYVVGCLLAFQFAVPFQEAATSTAAAPAPATATATAPVHAPALVRDVSPARAAAREAPSDATQAVKPVVAGSGGERREGDGVGVGVGDGAGNDAPGVTSAARVSRFQTLTVGSPASVVKKTMSDVKVAPDVNVAPTAADARASVWEIPSSAGSASWAAGRRSVAAEPAAVAPPPSASSSSPSSSTPSGAEKVVVVTGERAQGNDADAAVPSPSTPSPRSSTENPIDEADAERASTTTNAPATTSRETSTPAVGDGLAASAAARIDDEKLDKKSSRSSPSSSSSESSPSAVAATQLAAGWWRPLFYTAAIPAGVLAASALGGLAVESPVWLLGPEGCAVESRRSLALLLGIRGRAAVRWQEDVSGLDVVVGMDAAGKVMRRNTGGVVASESVGGAAGSGTDGDSEVKVDAAFVDRDERAIRSSWGQLTETRNRQPVTIGLGLCVLAAFSGSNTIIYYASTVLKEAGLTNPGLLTWAVGVPNLLGGIVALVATDKYGRRPLLLLSFGGMSACLAALAFAALITPGSASASFCAVFIPEAASGLPCVTCSSIAAICGDLPPPSFTADVALEPIRTVALATIPAYTLLFSLGAGPVPWLLYNEVGVSGRASVTESAWSWNAVYSKSICFDPYATKVICYIYII